MKTAKRFRNVKLLFSTLSILLLGLPAMVAAATCDEPATTAAKQRFNELRGQYVRDSSSVDKEDFRQAAADKPWGMREFAIETPDGHRIMFGQDID